MNNFLNKLNTVFDSVNGFITLSEKHSRNDFDETTITFYHEKVIAIEFRKKNEIVLESIFGDDVSESIEQYISGDVYSVHSLENIKDHDVLRRTISGMIDNIYSIGCAIHKDRVERIQKKIDNGNETLVGKILNRTNKKHGGESVQKIDKEIQELENLYQPTRTNFHTELEKKQKPWRYMQLINEEFTYDCDQESFLRIKCKSGKVFYKEICHDGYDLLNKFGTCSNVLYDLQPEKGQNNYCYRTIEYIDMSLALPEVYKQYKDFYLSN